tara:strand:- start:15355 stop:16356 length:1002 start_codon:yes stop_codon:yes gene_type:complete
MNMTDNYPPIIQEEETANKNSFPILAQLGILGGIFVIIFGSWAVSQLNATPQEATPTPTRLDLDDKQYPITPQKIEEVSITGEAAYVWDVKAQKALYSKNAETVLPLASITKLMTALVAHELVSENEKATVSLSAILQEGSSGFTDGEILTSEDLRNMALVSSSNDAAYALAANVGALLGEQDPVAQFVAGMNIRADELGLYTLDFKNTTGLDISANKPGAVGSARDVSFLMEHIVEAYPEILEPTQESATRIYNTAGSFHNANNTNKAVNEIPNLIGSKTGYTDLAGGNLTVAFDAGNNRPIIVTVLGSTRSERFTDVLNLISATELVLGNN